MMYRLLYTLFIYFLRLGFIVASPFNKKASKFVWGRVHLFRELKEKFASQPNEKVVWVHCASLGEFEQGRPIIEALKKNNPKLKILLTFFSPSGFEVRKNYDLADFVSYLPWDTPSQAKKFVQITQPSLAIFIKYEFWFFYVENLKRIHSHILSVSCILRSNQIFFRRYGSLFRQLLKHFDYFFTQNDETKHLLSSIGIDRAMVAGDTRFDRVEDIIQKRTEIHLVKQFKADQKIFVIGSCWPEDMQVLYPFINHQHDMKFIIAPHEISESFLLEMEKSIQVKSCRFSHQPKNIEHYSVLIIDNIGLLAQLYSYGEFAFIGGGFGSGLHNILEAACYGIPIYFGNKNFKNYKEANDLIMRGGAFEVVDYVDLKTKYESMMKQPEHYLLACEVARSYVQENLGATKKIMAYCDQVLSS